MKDMFDFVLKWKYLCKIENMFIFIILEEEGIK